MSRKSQDMIIDRTSLRIWNGTGDICLIMLHGIGSNKSSFDALANKLPENWTLIAWDAPGYGMSKHLSSSIPNASDYAARLKSLLDELNISSFLLLGHSLGTLIAARYALLFPKAVKGLILLASAQGYGVTDGRLPANAQSRLDDFDRLGAKEFARSRADRLIFEPELHPEIKEKTINTMAKINRQGYAQAVYMLASGNLNKDAGQLPISSLVMVGANDVVTPPIQSKNVHRELCNAAPDFPHIYLEIENAGHVVHQQRPNEVATRIIEFADTAYPAMAEFSA